MQKHVFIAKGTTKVVAPEGATAFYGGGQSSYVVFVNDNDETIGSFRAAGTWCNHYAEPCSEAEALRAIGMGQLRRGDSSKTIEATPL